MVDQPVLDEPPPDRLLAVGATNPDYRKAGVTRRDFVPALLSGVSFLAVAARPWRFLGHRRAWAPQPAFHALGTAYLERRGPTDLPKQFLEQVVSRSLRTGRHPGHLLAKERTADFVSGRTVILDGWIVAETEGLFCAGLSRSPVSTG